MKFNLLIFFLLVCSSESSCQTDSIPSGVWKVIAISDKEMYYDIKKDSLAVSKTSQDYPSSIEEQKRLKTGMRSVFEGVAFHFEKGLFKQTLQGEKVFDGTYLFLPHMNLLELTTKDATGNPHTSKIDFQAKNNLLYLKMKENDLPYNFILEKN